MFEQKTAHVQVTIMQLQQQQDPLDVPGPMLRWIVVSQMHGVNRRQLAFFVVPFAAHQSPCDKLELHHLLRLAHAIRPFCNITARFALLSYILLRYLYISTALKWCMCACSYGLDLFLLSIDEGIAGYRDDSLETVKRNEQTYGIPLKVCAASSASAASAITSSRKQEHVSFTTLHLTVGMDCA
jgi:hypothetical protein